MLRIDQGVHSADDACSKPRLSGVQMILAHRRTLQNRDYVILYAVAVVICFVLAGLRLRRSTNVSTQIVTLILSAMWAGQGCLMFGETCPSARYILFWLHGQHPHRRARVRFRV